MYTMYLIYTLYNVHHEQYEEGNKIINFFLMSVITEIETSPTKMYFQASGYISGAKHCLLSTKQYKNHRFSQKVSPIGIIDEDKL